MWKNDDLGFFDLFSKCVLATVAIVATTGWTGPLTAAVLTVAETGLNFWRRGNKLTKDQLQLLIALEANKKGLTNEELKKYFSRKPEPWSQKKISATLTSLENFLRNDNKDASLIQKGNDNRWRSIHKS